MTTTNNDSLTAIAHDLDQLADEVEGNESRPAADDICARARQASQRCRALVVVAPPVDAVTLVEDAHDREMERLYAGKENQPKATTPKPKTAHAATKHK